MRRRHFLSALAAALPARSLPAFQGPARTAKLPIAAVEVLKLEGRREARGGVDQQRQVNPLNVYEGMGNRPYRDSATPSTRMVPASALYLRIRTTQGLDGLYGPIDREAADLVRQDLRPFLLGKDALAARPSGTRCTAPTGTPAPACS